MDWLEKQELVAHPKDVHGVWMYRHALLSYLIMGSHIIPMDSFQHESYASQINKWRLSHLPFLNLYSILHFIYSLELVACLSRMVKDDSPWRIGGAIKKRKCGDGQPASKLTR